MDKGIQDSTLGTVGWFAFAAGTVGLTAGQTLRLSAVNLSPSDAIILCGIWSNPRALLLAERSHTLGIYSGRHYRHLEKAQLGIVWKRRAIDETILGGR